MREAEERKPKKEGVKTEGARCGGKQNGGGSQTETDPGREGAREGGSAERGPVMTSTQRAGGPQECAKEELVLGVASASPRETSAVWLFLLLGGHCSLSLSLSLCPPVYFSFFLSC